MNGEKTKRTVQTQFFTSLKLAVMFLAVVQSQTDTAHTHIERSLFRHQYNGIRT